MVEPDDAASWRAVALAVSNEDPDPRTQLELRQAAEAGDDAAIKAAFQPRLEFGTAGLRGAVGPGPARMNLLVCARFAWALGTFLTRRPELAARGVVIGFDARRDSERFARLIERILAGFELELWTAAAPVPTPLVAFGVRLVQAGAGVVVTASHNPAGDNGIKLYDELGMQIVGPWDVEIEALMQVAPSHPDIVQKAPSSRSLDLEVFPAYLAQLRARGARGGGEGKVRVAYTPLHGVGGSVLAAAVASSEVELVVVPEQAEPNPDFPTTPFPNPEEPGVLDRLLGLARREQVDLALANDPDADRLAVALSDGRGDYLALGGDEVGLLLCECLFELEPEAPVCINSVVSSPGLDAWAREHSGRALHTLTGFKWLARAARAEPRFLLAYEEALGYSSPAPLGHLGALDKDGLAAAMDLIAFVRRLGSGAALLERLAAISMKIGVWVCHAASVRLTGEAANAGARRVMERLRQGPPQRLGTEAVTEVVDYLEGAQLRSPLLGRQDLLAFGTSSGARVLVRPSGTEPKIKIYTHVVGPARGPSGLDYLARRHELLDVAARITGEIRQRASAP